MVLLPIALLLGMPNSQSALQEERPTVSVGNWTVYENDDNCAAMTDYDSGVGMWISFASRSGDVTVVVTDPAFKSIESGKDYPLELYFMFGKRLDSGWGTVTAKGIVVNENTRGFRMKLKGDDFLPDVAKASTIAFLRGEIVVSSLDLTGSADMVTALRRCAQRVEKLRPSDPFAL